MAISEKENLLRYYRHERPERMANLSCYFKVHPARGYRERPIFKNGVTDDPKDWFGVEYIFEPGVGAAMPDPSKPKILTDITKWREQVVFPDLDNMDWETAAAMDHVAELDRENKVIVALVQCGIYERMHALMGMEDACMAFLEEPEDTRDFLNAIGDYKYKLFERIIRYYKPDIIRQHDDYGSQISMQMSPAVWRDMIKPITKRLVELCHANGVAYEQHSCGMIEDIIPDFVEIGIDSWQGMHINDVQKLQQMTKGRLVYHMALDIQRYRVEDATGRLDEEKLRADVRKTILECGADATYFPILAVVDPKWWGTAVILDEIERSRPLVKFR